MKRFARLRQSRRNSNESKGPAAPTPSTEETIPDETTPILSEKKIRFSEEVADDGHFDQTNGHKIATYLSKYSFYNPAKDKEPIIVQSKVADDESDTPKKVLNPPSLEEAWNFFEYQCLPRRFVHIEDQGEGRKYVRASLGEKEPTKLYPVIDTPLEDMADFGIGVGMYFQTVRYFGFVCFIAGCLSIPMMAYYRSYTYSPHLVDKSFSEFFSSISGVCGDQRYQPCPNCPNVTSDMTSERIIEVDDMKFILTNQCELSTSFGWYAYASLIFVLVATYVFVYLQRRYRISLDESEQTSTDYSIRITNPPESESARDPETWKKFFEEKFENVQVAVCTVALNNEELVKLLLKKFDLRMKLKSMLPQDVEYDESDLDVMAHHSKPKPHIKRRTLIITFVLIFLLCFFVFEFLFKHSALAATLGILVMNRLNRKQLTSDEIAAKICELDEKINALAAEGDFDVSNVFVTFETEEMQRTVLKSLKVPEFRLDEINEEFKFEGVVLEVEEPDEPSSMRWQDLDVPFWVEQRQKAISFGSAFVFTIFGGFVIYYAKTHSAIYSTIAIILLNALTPRVVNRLTDAESHDTETSYTASAYIKVTFIRWVYTVLVNFAITPFTNILASGKLIESIRLLYTAELLNRPILQLLDYGGHIKRHFRGPRKKDQREMNLAFMPKSYSIGERYTEITKLLFFTFFYAIVFPMGFFYAAAIFFVYFWVDKFCILRQWKQGPKINAEISLFSTYYLWLTIFAYAFVAAYTVAEFPFDDACLTSESPDAYFGTFESSFGNFTISSRDKVYEYCNQDIFFGTGMKSFPPLPSRLADASEWMSPEQVEVATRFSWALVFISVLLFFSIVIRLFLRVVKPMFDETWTPEGKASDEGFSDVPEIYAFVPSVVKKGYQYPILLCDVSDVDDDLISWTCDFTEYSVIYDVPEEYRKSSFALVKNWDTKATGDVPAPRFQNHKSEISVSSFLKYYLGL